MSSAAKAAKALRDLEEKRKDLANQKDIRADARRAARTVRTRDMEKMDHRLTSLLKSLGAAMTTLHEYNADPAVEYYGDEPLDLSMGLQALHAEVLRRLGKDPGTIKRIMNIIAAGSPRNPVQSAKSEVRASEMRAMDAFVKAGHSINKAARLVVGAGRSVSPLLKRYRRARRAVAK